MKLADPPSNPQFEPLEPRLLLDGQDVSFLLQDVTVGGQPCGIVSADFDADGRLDFATTNELDNTVSVLYGQAGGSFGGRQDFAVGCYPRSVISSDFNDDGRPDLAVTNWRDASVSVLYGQAGGGFSSARQESVDRYPDDLVSGDFNGDGRLDLAVSNYGLTTVSVLYGTEDGGFTRQDVVVGYRPTGLATGDFNADGWLDFAVANHGRSDVSVVYNQGGEFLPANVEVIPVGPHPNRLVAEDFNEDGRLDLAVTNNLDNVNPSTVTVLYGQSDGGFGDRQDVDAGLGPWGIVSADFNSDGSLDLAVTTIAGNVSLLYGQVSGGFGDRQNVAVGDGPRGITSADFNGDGLPDLAVTNAHDDDVSVLTVMPVNRAPVAEDDAAETDEDTPVVIDVLANDADPDGNPLLVSDFTQPAHGAVTENPDGTLTYTPELNYNGADGFTYTVSDGIGAQPLSELEWSAYLGGGNEDRGLGIAVDAGANVLVTGETQSSGWASGGFDTDYGGGGDVFVAKFDASGNPVWSTYLGGGSFDAGYGVAVDGAGDVYIVGETWSSGWASGGYSGSGDAFVAKLSAAGDYLWSVYLGGSGYDAGYGDIVVDATGSVYAGGFTTSAGWVSGGFDTSYGGGIDAFVVKLSASGDHLWSTYLGGDQEDNGQGIAVDSAGDVYVTGFTYSDGWVSGGFDTGYNGLDDAFVAKISSSGDHLLWSTYLGGGASDDGYGVGVDSAGGVYVAGVTYSSGWASGGFDTSYDGGGDGFVTKFSSSGSHLWSTYFGGSACDCGYDIAVESGGGAYITGFTDSAGWVSDGFDTSYNGGRDAIVVKMSASGGNLWSTYLGDTHDDRGYGIAVDGAGVAYVTGFWGGLDIAHGGGRDAFAAKISPLNTGDGQGGTTTAEVSVTVRPVNDAPVADDQSVTVAEDGSVQIALTGTDVETPHGDLVAAIVEGPSHGTLTLVSCLTYRYDPAPDHNGPDSFQVTLTDDGDPSGGHSNPGDLTSEPATISITVTPVNDAPEAIEGVTGTEEDVPVLVDMRTLADDLETTDDGLTFTVGNAWNGSVQLLSDGYTAEFTPAPDYSGAAGFDYWVTDTGDPADGDKGWGYADPIEVGPTPVSVEVKNLVDLSGRVFEDRDNDGLFEPDDGDTPLEGVTVSLLDQVAGTPIAQTATGEDGTYAFDVNLDPGTYTIAAEQPAAYLDGKETPGTIGGTADNSQDWQEIGNILVPEGIETPDGTGYDFAELQPASLQGFVWEDFDDNGEMDLGELAVEGVRIQVTGTDDRGAPVDIEQLTNAQGLFEFTGLRPGTYAIAETQPEGFVDGQEALGEVVEFEPPTPPVILGDDGYIDLVGDRFAGIKLVAGSSGIDYNFGERIDGGQVHAGQTATIGFWQNKNGQALIKSLNGSADSTLLADWLAETFPNMYGQLAGMANHEIAAMYQQLFKRNAKTSPGGPPKLDAQVMGVALATFITKESLVSLWYGPPDPDVNLIAQVESYGFAVTAGGVGAAFFNIGASGAAFDGYDDYEDVQVIDLLRATDRMSLAGLLYDDADCDGAGDGEIDDFERMLRTLANEVYTAINEAGDI